MCLLFCLILYEFFSGSVSEVSSAKQRWSCSIVVLQNRRRVRHTMCLLLWWWIWTKRSQIYHVSKRYFLERDCTIILRERSVYSLAFGAFPGILKRLKWHWKAQKKLRQIIIKELAGIYDRTYLLFDPPCTLKGQFHGSAHVHKSKYFFRSLSMLSLSKPHSHVVQ